MNHSPIEIFFINLKTISKLKVTDKFYINLQRQIIVIKNDIYQSIYRIFLGECRKKNLVELSELYSNIISYIEDKLQSKYLHNDSELSDMENEFHSKLLYILNRLGTELSSSKDGLENLKLTYSGDILVESQLDNIINNIDNIIVRLDKKLN